MDLDSWTKQDLERLAEVSNIGHPARIAILLGLDSGKSTTDIAKFLDITRASLQDHVDKLVDAELIYRPSEKGQAYSLTPLGQYYAIRLQEDGNVIIKVLDRLDDSEQKVREEKGYTQPELEHSDLPVDEGKVERELHTAKWERVMDDISELIQNQRLTEEDLD